MNEQTPSIIVFVTLVPMPRGPSPNEEDADRIAAKFAGLAGVL
jgi:hypothetical protein